MNVRVEKNDISIAHRLPSKNGTPKPVIARFTRRVTKIQLLTKKKNLHGNALLGNVRIYEDATKARKNFMNLLRSDDERINKAWIREGTIFLDWKNNEHRKKTWPLWRSWIGTIQLWNGYKVLWNKMNQQNSPGIRK